MSAARETPGTYSKAPLIACDVYQHANGKQYHAVKRGGPAWSQVRGDIHAAEGEGDSIALFPVNAKTGRAWQAARYFQIADVKLIGTIEI